MTSFTTDQWVILGLTFMLGLLIGAWLTSGGRSKWKTRHANEVTERKALEAKLKAREAHFAAQEKEWRAETSRHQAALRERPAVGTQRREEPFVEDRRPAMRHDMDRDGVTDRHDERPMDPRRG